MYLSKNRLGPEGVWREGGRVEGQCLLKIVIANGLEFSYLMMMMMMMMIIIFEGVG